jgi:AraC-like DNA-binding protein
MQISGNDANKFGEFFLKIGSTNAGFRLGFFIYLLQKMSNYKNWQYLSTQSFAMNMTDCEGLRMNEIYRYTLDNFQKNITLEEIASVACLTPQSFCRYFKKNNAKTYIQFLNELRINEACKRFIEDNFDSIGNVAYKCGFNSVVSFNRVFKTITKKTPKGFIKTYNFIN